MTNPAVNWVAFDSGLGADGYGVAIANLSASINSPDGAKERCGEGHFLQMTNTDPSNSERYLTIIEGDSSKVAWEVNLGDAKYIALPQSLSMSMAMEELRLLLHTIQTLL